jgi:phospholipid/cholesterol/gamma-HCH transport system substrate-binding protein
MTTPLDPRAVIGMAIVVLLGGLSVLGVQQATGEFDADYELVAVFDEGVGQGLDTFSDVRIRGVPIGTVEAIDLGDDGRLRLRMSIQPEVEVPEGSRIEVEPLSLFGPRYVDVVTADGPPLEPGSVLTMTAASPELGELVESATGLLQSLDAEQITTVLGELADGLDGRGPSIAQGIDGLDDTTTVLDARTAETRALLDDVRALTDEFSGRGAQLTGAAGQLAQVLPRYTATEADVARVLDDVAVAFGEISTLLELHADELGPTIDGLQRTADTLNDNRARVPELVALFDEVFAFLSGVIRLEHDQGLQAAVDIQFTTNSPCELFEVCFEGGLPLPGAP